MSSNDKSNQENAASDFFQDKKISLPSLEKIEQMSAEEKKKLYDHIQSLYQTIDAYEKTMEMSMQEKKEIYSRLESFEKVLELSELEKKDLMKSLQSKTTPEKSEEELEKRRLKNIAGGPDMVLETDNLVKMFKKFRAVDGISIKLRKGEVVGLLGPNGAGKTTTFYMIVGLENPTEGTVFHNDQDITQYPMYKRARLGINYLPQESSIFRKLTVQENIMAILELRKDINSKQKKEKALDLMDRLDIEYIADQKAYALSGGERRRVEIARSLASDPHFLLLDEPFAGIDPIAVQEIQQIVHKLVEETGVGILITDHNARETLRITDRAYIIVEGTIFTSGTSAQLATREEVKKIYLGDNFTL
jgi:lipopolysaccharide export system ATP-binding protein